MEHFRRALSIAEQTESRTQHKLIAAAHKELGFYYRNEGRWIEADESYAKARQAISASLSAASPPEDREEMASIQTNWAYVKGLTGSYREGASLVEAAIDVRRRLNLRHEEGMSWSVSGEVHRYEGNFREAWKSYAEAEQIFQVHRNWSWLGLVYQEQAICLYQAWDGGQGLSLLPEGRDPLTQSKRLITLALDLCRDLAVRGYPSALNRAGRIYGDEPEKALEYLVEGISWARRLSDGWFWFANLIEYAELCYRQWLTTADQAYRDHIDEQSDEVARISTEYEFPDLRGRWRLLQGHLRVLDWRASLDERLLRLARDDFRDGFILIGQTSIGSSGGSAVPGEFRKVRDLIRDLPRNIQTEWQAEFKRAWSLEEYGKTSLLASLETLY
jgi:tetratricopeptide (TPR) repeat protein